MTVRLLVIPLLLALVGLGGCDEPTDLEDLDTEAPTDEPTPEPTPADYDGPAYRSCVSDAQCRPGDACTTVPGYSGQFCAPACDPTGDGAECALPGLPFDTMCLESGRCARECGASEIPGTINQEGDAIYELCPSSVSCENVDGLRLCAGETFGQAGNYGTCSHPMQDGSDCPPETSCVGGAVLGTDDIGICLPWCDDGSCPTPPGHAFNTTPLCYDVLLEHPMCALLCDFGDPLTTCPDEGQECQEFYGFGICAPPGATPPDIL